MRLLNILCLIAVVGAVAVVYQMKYAVERHSDQVDILKGRIASEREAIALLKAEWSLLNQPARLHDLAKENHEHLGLSTMHPTQVVTTKTLAIAPAPAANASQNHDDIITGATRAADPVASVKPASDADAESPQ